MEQAGVVICGAGIAGVSVAHALALDYGLSDILLVDERPPLSLTSDHSTECYRNWWPDAPMAALMNHSIGLLDTLADASSNRFQLNRRGYLYCLTRPELVAAFEQQAAAVAQAGGGPLRVYHAGSSPAAYAPAPAEGYHHQPQGADLLLDPALIQAHFPYLSPAVCAALHVRQAGWFSAQQLGMTLLERARAQGVRLRRGRVTAVDCPNGQIEAVHLDDGTCIRTNVLVNAAGPQVQQVARLVGVELPVYHEAHYKLAVKDSLAALPRHAPLVILAEAQRLDWDEDERQALDEDPTLRFLLDELPAGLHTRPEGGEGSQMALILWEYASHRVADGESFDPAQPPDPDAIFPEVLLRGLARLIPAVRPYSQKPPRPHIDGGYYTRTAENRPLLGALPVGGAYVCGAFSGFGMMAACGAADLVARSITGAALPAFAAAFDPLRCFQPDYQAGLSAENGQL